ncbi:hypothetical protein D3C77_462110 [compost metagenome]
MQLTLMRKLKLQFIIYKTLKCRQPLKAIYNYHFTLAIFRQIENRQRNPHHNRLNQLTLFIFSPDKISLKIRIHHETSLFDTTQYVVDGPIFISNKYGINWIMAEGNILISV